MWHGEPVKLDQGPHNGLKHCAQVGWVTSLERSATREARIIDKVVQAASPGDRRLDDPLRLARRLISRQQWELAALPDLRPAPVLPVNRPGAPHRLSSPPPQKSSNHGRAVI